MAKLGIVGTRQAVSVVLKNVSLALVVSLFFKDI